MLLVMAALAGLVVWFIAAPTHDAARRQAGGHAVAGLPTPPRRALADAVTAAPASAIGVALEDPATCGQDQLPVYREEHNPDGSMHVDVPVPDPDGVFRGTARQAKPPGVGYAGAMHRLDASLRASIDPFDRAAADWLDLGAVFGTPGARLEALVQDALSTDDGRVYALAYQSCTNSPDFSEPWGPHHLTSSGCARLSATEWARRDPGNAMPWLFELAQAREAGNDATVATAMSRIADATRLVQRPYAVAAALARLPLRLPADLSPQEDAAARAVMAYTALSGTGFITLNNQCRDVPAANATRLDECRRIATMLYEHADTSLPRLFGASIHQRLTGDEAWRTRAEEDNRLAAEASVAGAAQTPCASERSRLQYIVRADALGEVGLAREARAAADPASTVPR